MKPLAVLVLVGCGGGTSSAPVPTAGALPHEAAPSAAACITPGYYKVTVDLTHAEITQVNTGMTDTDWCRSMLMAVPSSQMNAMRIGYEDGALAVRWPPSRKVHAQATADACAFAIADEPIPVTITFAGGGNTAEGIATYSLGTANHPDESCTATNAKLVLERAGE